MSPEQIRGQKDDARSDVFSLGAVFYELLCNHRPFEADSAHDVRFQIVEQAPEPIRRWAPDVPPALVAVVERALAKDPARRFADVGEMGRALATARSVIEGDTVAAPRPAAGDRTVVQGGDATVAQAPGSGSAYGTVRVATAHTLARAPAAAGKSHLPRTVRPDPTVAGGEARRPPHAPAAPRARSSLAAWRSSRWPSRWGSCGSASGRRPPGAAPTAAGPDQAGIMTDVFVTNQVELARADLADRDFGSAARRAEEALKLNPGSVDAREVLEQARQAERQIEESVAQARAAFGRGDVASSSEALGRVMALAPRHPVVAELSAALKEHLRPQAEDSRRQAESARQAAEAARATSFAGFQQGGRLAAEADAFLRRQDYANAAQKYLESRNAFERVKRDADEARALAARCSRATSSRRGGPFSGHYSPIRTRPSRGGTSGSPAFRPTMSAVISSM